MANDSELRKLRKQKKKYPPPLDQPIYVDKSHRYWESRLDGKLEARKEALFEFFDIDKTTHAAWMLLAYRLMERHVPGLKVTYGDGKQRERKRGRPKTRNLRATKAALVEDMTAELKKTNRKLSDPQIAKRLKREHPEKYGSIQESTLTTRIREARAYVERPTALRRTLAKLMGYNK